MKVRRMLIVVTAGVVLLACGSAFAQRYGDEYRDTSTFGRMQHKLGRGLANLFTGVVEIPKNISREWRKTDPATGVLVGGAKGVGWAASRMAVGAFETVTFPVPVPPNYEPLMEPEFPLPDIWGEQLPYFDRDGDPKITL